MADAIAAIIVEPIAGNMSLVPPVPGFLEGLRALCDRHGALLIFDEVMTGFRVAWGGAQNLLGVRPDLTTLGKVIGGGLPLAAYGGRRDLMQRIAPAGPVYQAGTLSGNPLAVAAGRAALDRARQGRSLPLRAPGEDRRPPCRRDRGGRPAPRHPLPGRAPGLDAGPLLHRRARCAGMEDVHATDRPRFARVFHSLLDRGRPPAALALRGDVPLDRPRRRRDRGHPRGLRRRLRRGGRHGRG